MYIILMSNFLTPKIIKIG